MGYRAGRYMAEYWMGTGNTRQAIEGYRSLVQFFPSEDADLYLKLYDLHLKDGNEEAARKLIKKAKRIFPTNARVQWRF